MTTSSLRALRAPVNAPLHANGTPRRPESGPSDSVILGGSVPGPQLRPSASPALATQGSAAEKPDNSPGLPFWMRAVGFGLTGALGVTALTGCTGGTKSTNTSGPVTEQVKEARTHLSATLAQIEKEMQNLPADGGGAKQAEQVTRKVMDAARRYARESGRQGPGVVEDLRQFMGDHPAVTITALFALGTTAGVGLEKAGLSDAVSQGVKNVWQWAKDHPFLASGIALGAAGGAAYLIHQLVLTEGEVPTKPTTPEAQRLESTFKSLEERISANPNLDGGELHKSLYDSISEYQKATNKRWEEVAQDVKAFAYEHPLVAATLITTAGVATGVVLERAGVPDKVAGLIGGALNSGKNGASKLAELVKEHPVVSGAVAVGVASGVGYLVYNHYNQAPAPAAQ